MEFISGIVRLCRKDMVNIRERPYFIIKHLNIGQITMNNKGIKEIGMNYKWLLTALKLDENAPPDFVVLSQLSSA